MTKLYNKIQYVAGVLLLLGLFFHVGGSTIQAQEIDDPGRERLSGEVSAAYDQEILPELPVISLFSLENYANPYTGVQYTHSSVYDNCDLVYGIDVSKYQGDINWTKVKADGIDFAFIRAGYRGYGSAGTLVKDDYFIKNIENATLAGVKVGAYIFSQATTVAEAEEEANYLVSLVSGYQISMPLVMDFEYASVNGKVGGRLYDAKLSAAQATKVCNAFCAKVESYGYESMLYANKSMLENQVNVASISNQYKIWLANYVTETEYAGSYDFWQYSSKGKINGITGNVDCNYWYVARSDSENNGDNNINQTPSDGTTSEEVTLPNEGTTPNEGETPDVEIPEEVIIPEITTTKVTGLKKSASTTTSITLQWSKVADATGYQVYRASSLNGTYTKIKTIASGSTVSYKQTGLTSAREYYYKVRAYQTLDGKNYYSAFSSKLTTYTKASYTRSAVTKVQYAMKKTTSTTGTTVKTVVKGASLSVVSFGYDTSGNTWYRVKYTKNGTTYTGYIPASKLTIYKYGKTTANVYMRKNAGTNYAVISSVAKSTKLTIMSSKKDSKGTTWYYVKYTKKGIAYKGYVCGLYIKNI